MSTEIRRFVKIPKAAAETVAELDRRSIAMLERAQKSPVGDRTEVVRFEVFQTEIESLAIAAANGGAPCVEEDQPASTDSRSCVVRKDLLPTDLSAPTIKQVRSWLSKGSLVVECCSPLSAGLTARPEGTGTVRSAAEPWKSQKGNRGKSAVRERFLAQLESAVSSESNVPATISPTGVSNSVLTDGLRSFAASANGSPPVDVGVAYRDGSSARPFPLRGLDLVDDSEPIGRILTFSLLSIRHVDLDVLVDGAWLRNSEVSRIRPAGETDELVYLESVRQLDLLCRDQPTTIVMYQTGLETAIMGFYRAVTEYLAKRPHDLSILPRYYQTASDYEPGKAWRIR